jgi:CMP-N,N'-diacetyllegionaminic acid synthase
MTHIGIVPARGGSKRLPRKNIRAIAGQPLLAWTAQAALASKLERVILSTDDDEIASVGRSQGLEVPFLRPLAIADDATPMLPVLAHLIEWLEAAGTKPASIVLLQPTSPLRLPRHIDEAIAMFDRKKAETVVSVTDVPNGFGPGKFMRMDAGGAVTKADFSDNGDLVVRNGPAILMTAPDAIRRGTLYGSPTLGYRMDRASSVDIDDEDDFAFAEFLLLRRQGKA